MNILIANIRQRGKVYPNCDEWVEQVSTIELARVRAWREYCALTREEKRHGSTVEIRLQADGSMDYDLDEDFEARKRALEEIEEDAYANG